MQTTQAVTAKYTELYDISTEIGENVHYKIHTPTGVAHMKKLAGFYKQFKEYKYLGASIAWVPITTLPKDLLGVGYEAGDGVDPRDLINPILHKGYKGESLITDYLSERTLWSENTDATDAGNQGVHQERKPRMTESGGASYQKITGTEPYAQTIRDTVRAMYYTSLTDPEWGKAHPREGFYRELFSVVRTLASTGPISGNAIRQDLPKETPADNANGTTNELYVDRDITKAPNIRVAAPTNDSGPQNLGSISFTNTGQLMGMTAPESVRGYHPVNMTDVFTHEFERLGWMETSGKGTSIGFDTVGWRNNNSESLTDLDINRMPKVYMYLVQTPPAYKQRQYYRMSITHNFAFRKFRQVYGIDMPNIWSDEKVDNIGKHEQMNRMYGATVGRIAGMKMYDDTGTLHDDDFMIPEYEPALENTIEADGVGTTIEKISDGVA